MKVVDRRGGETDEEPGSSGTGGGGHGEGVQDFSME